MSTTRAHHRLRPPACRCRGGRLFNRRFVTKSVCASHKLRVSQSPLPVSLKDRPKGGLLRTTAESRTRVGSWECHNKLTLQCATHGGRIKVRCGRWRTCPGCALYKQWRLERRFIAGISNVPSDRYAAFVTLTFSEDRAPDAESAHRCLRKLIGRLRYRGDLAEYGWVLQRQSNGTLHYHGIFHMRWYDDDLAAWREMVVKSGFGPQNKIVAAHEHHARYCAKYMSQRLADVGSGHRAFGFSRHFPKPADRMEDGPEDIGAWVRKQGECEWHAVPF